jgi:excisionase family DNA binding protein
MQLLNTEEAAKRLYTTPYTVRKYIRQGKLAAARIGKQYLIMEEELLELLKKLTFKVRPEDGQ